MNKFDIDHFIKKFEAIPDYLWTVGNFTDGVRTTKCCALGHCGERSTSHTEEALALIALFAGQALSVAEVNDGEHSYFQQPTPKQRILAALHHLKAQTT